MILHSNVLPESFFANMKGSRSMVMGNSNPTLRFTFSWNPICHMLLKSKPNKYKRITRYYYWELPHNKAYVCNLYVYYISTSIKVNTINNQCYYTIILISNKTKKLEQFLPQKGMHFNKQRSIWMRLNFHNIFFLFSVGIPREKCIVIKYQHSLFTLKCFSFQKV